ncbi:hypothetical protein ATY43_12705 [Xanthomonas oryzae pv. oryzae]|nr:hypothetical protein APZ20_06585 [Xanthomonas oryzae pv. oryzae]AOS06782.1 hypothetical protein ATY43_12705 [Xanthomonas oryzae pv. oryzae]AOS10041.1 hypothetical protein ATY44_06625 [Xanthomonas oryzae pv. oryzae]AOS14206.1 hypothetical protein ATY45_06405 [Xanthomonas oryzae pv. oryzae]
MGGRRVDDTTFRAVYERGDQTLRDALDLAYLTGQRVGDVWSMDERQLGAGELVVRQAKTGTKLTMAVTGELAALLDRIAARKRGLTLRSTRLIVDADGLAIGRAGPRCATASTRRARPPAWTRQIQPAISARLRHS